jgi:dipeptidyl aminopeptidase/acylaminoacyl peptidase
VPDKARVHVYRFGVEDGKKTKLVDGKRRVSQLNLAKNNSYFAFASEDNDHPTELFTAMTDSSQVFQRSEFHKDFLEEVKLGQTEKILFKNPDGQTVEGFVLRPGDFDPRKKYPLILKIHGGPQGTDGNYFSAEGQWYAANGYIVLWVNYRGSSDYGEAWQEAIAVDWYFKEYDDLMAAVDFMCQQEYVDSQRLGVTGVSYGGCMTTWIVGHTDRFAAAVAERFVADNFSSFGVDDTAYWYEKDFGLPYDEKNFTQYRKTSPILYPVSENITHSLHQELHNSHSHHAVYGRSPLPPSSGSPILHGPQEAEKS